MSKLKLVLDSGCDVLPEVAAQKDITIVPFSVSFDGKTYKKEHFEISIEEFYEKLKQRDTYPKTSLPSIQEYADVFKKEIEIGNQVLCICLSSKLSGSYQSAVNAKDIVLEEYPEGKICVIDSQLATYAYYLLGLKGLRLFDEGKSLEEIENVLLESRKDTKMYFVLDDLDFLREGGRLGKGAVLASNILNIKPVLEFSDGEIKPFKKIRGLKKAFSTLIDILELDVKALKERKKDCHIMLVYAGNPAYTGQIREALEKRFDINEHEILHVNLGSTIASHTGPDMVGVGVTIKD